jgi:hypothetical protein
MRRHLHRAQLIDEVFRVTVGCASTADRNFAAMWLRTRMPMDFGGD